MMAAQLRRPLGDFGWADWMFVLFSWLTAAYFFSFIFDIYFVKTGVKIDFMPILVGAITIPIGWYALRLGARVERAVQGLDDGAGINIPDDVSLVDFQNDRIASIRWWERVMGIAIATVLLIGFVYVLWTGRLTGKKSSIYDASVYELAAAGVLGAVMCTAGYLIGSILGAMVSYGNLHKVMERHRITFAGLATREARTAMRGLEGVFGIAVFVTMLLCQWFGGWLFLWRIGFDPHEYARPWRGLFEVLWAISFALYLVTALVPIRAFQKRLEPLYGGAEGRRALDGQLADATRERTALAQAVAAGDWRRREELTELDRFIVDLNERRFRAVLLRSELLYCFAAWNLISVGIPWILAG